MEIQEYQQANSLQLPQGRYKIKKQKKGEIEKDWETSE